MMKKISIVLILLTLSVAFICPFTAFCDEAGEIIAETAIAAPEGIAEPLRASDAVVPTEPFTWAYLATIAGAAAFTLIVVQLCKVPLDKVWHIPTRLLVYIICLLVMIAATHFTVGLGWENGLLAAVNAFIAALTAYGAYEITFAKRDGK